MAWGSACGWNEIGVREGFQTVPEPDVFHALEKGARLGIIE
jgi:hypothetical protein